MLREGNLNVFHWDLYQSNNISILLYSSLSIAREDKSSDSSVIVPGTLRQSTHKTEYWNIYKTSCGVARRAMLRAQRERNRLGFEILQSINLVNRKEKKLHWVKYSISQGHRQKRLEQHGHQFSLAKLMVHLKNHLTSRPRCESHVFSNLSEQYRLSILLFYSYMATRLWQIWILNSNISTHISAIKMKPI